MSQVYYLVNAAVRAHAAAAVNNAPDGYVVRIEAAKRTQEQNALMWALLTDIARQVEWYGQYLSTDDWKNILTAALRRERVVPGINGGFVVLGQQTSKMSKREMGDLLDLIQAFGAERGVKFSGPDVRYAEVSFDS